MTLPGFYVKEEELTLNVPAEADLIVALAGPSSKGTPNVLGEFGSEANFVAAHGKPVNRHYSARAGIRFLRQGNLLKYNRIAGTLIASALRLLYASGELILTVTAASPGTWANSDISVSLLQNSATEYNIRVYDRGRAIPGEHWKNNTNGDVATKINGNSAYITVAVAAGAGTTAPDETRDIVTGALTPLTLLGGDDGAFASTRSADSSTGGIAGKRFFGLMDSVGGARTWYNLDTIDAAHAGTTIYRGTVGMPIQPGTFTVRVPNGVGTWLELSDNEDDALVNGMVYGGVGLLVDGATTHRGFVNYRTGVFGVILVGGPVLQLAQTVDAIFVRARWDGVGTLLAGQTTYSGALASPDVCPGSATSARAQFQVTADDTICTDSGIAAAQHDSGDANCQVMDGYVVPGTISVTAPTATGTQTVYDDGFGGWRTAAYGAGVAVVGTMNYRTGAWDITFAAVVPANSPITSEYQFIVADMGSAAVAGPTGQYTAADQVCTNATGGAPQIDSADANCAAMITVPVVPGSIRFVCDDVVGVPETIFDDGVGGLCSFRRGDPNAIDVVGTVNYATGAWDITWSGNVGAGAVIDASYVPVAESDNVHDLRASTVRIDYTDPATANDFRSENWLNYITGAFRFKFNIDATHDLLNNATIYAVYQHGELLGWGDGTTVAFAGTVVDAPVRREADRMIGFQGGQQAAGGVGDAQVTLAALGPPDFWDQNVGGGAAANPIDFATGVTQIQWTAAPYNGEAAFIVAEETVGNVTSQWTGCVGNERATITDGLYAILDVSPTVATQLRFRVLFNDGTGAVAIESWDLLDDFADLLATVNATDGTGSNLVTIEDTGAGTQPDVTASQNLGMNGAFTNADVVGVKVGPTYTGLQLFSNPDTIAVDVIATPGQWHRQIQDAGITLAEAEGRRALWLFSQPDFTPPAMMTDSLPGVRSVDLAGDSADFTNGNYNSALPGGIARPTAWVPYPPLSIVNSDYACTHAFYIQYFDQYLNQDVWEGPEGDFAQMAAKTDRQQERWFPIAGSQRGLFADVIQLRYSPDVDDRETMYEFDGVLQNVVNPIRTKIGIGPFIDGQRTMYRTTSVRDRINVRLLLNKLENLLEIANLRYEFELNDPILWAQVEATGRLIIRPMLSRRGLANATLVCDRTTNTPDVIAAKTCLSRLMIQPEEAAEIIQYNVVLVPSGVIFEEVVV